MYSLRSSCLVIVLLALSGCGDSSKGGPGATPPSTNKPVAPASGGTFTLSTSPDSVTLKQGEAKAFTVTIKRNDNFQEDVTLQFEGMPKGSTVEPKNPLIARGDTEVKFTLKTDQDAALGDFKVSMVGHPTKGLDSVSELKVTIETK